ncbi:MAG: hypothetical protein NTZ72_17480, partial [Afipia sp.]|nr:hypothetical protein [Afipia sp.]
MQPGSKLPANLAVTTFASIGSASARYFVNQPGTTIWYLGSNYARWLELQDRFGARCAPVAQAVNAAAQTLLPLMLDLDGALA